MFVWSQTKTKKSTMAGELQAAPQTFVVMAEPLGISRVANTPPNLEFDPPDLL